jgi:hypothetical protein
MSLSLIAHLKITGFGSGKKKMSEEAIEAQTPASVGAG